MELINNYQEALQAIYDHVGFVEDWVVYPIDDQTDKFWDTDGEGVWYADSEEEFVNEDGNFYWDVVYTQRFYSKHVYEGDELTMIFCDPSVDGMKWFRIFLNNNRRNK